MAPNRPFPVDPVLTAVAIGYRNPAYTFIADQVLPRVAVGGEKFKWIEYPLNEAFRAPENKVGRTSRINRVEFSGEERTDSVADYGLESPIPNSDIEAAANMRALGLGNFDPEQRAVTGIEDYNWICREKRVAALVQDPANYGAGQKLTLSGTDQLSDYENSDPIGVFKECLGSTTIFRANQMAMGFEAWDIISSNPKLVNAVRGNLTSEGIITPEQLAQLLNIQRVLVGEAYLDAAEYGQAPDVQRIWGRNIVFQHINPNPLPEQGTITHGFTAQYGSKIAGSLEDPNIGLQGGKSVRSGERIKELIVAKGVGFLLQDAVAPRV